MNNVWKTAPTWFQDGEAWELSGPFFSVACEPQGYGEFQLVFACSGNEQIHEKTFTDLEIAKNQATMWYNQILHDMVVADPAQETEHA